MRRLLITLTLLIAVASAAFAEKPAFLQLFDGRYNDTPGVEWSKIKREGKTSYYLDFKKNPKLAKEIKALLDKSLNVTEYDTEIITKNENYYKTTVELNGEEVAICLSIRKDGSGNLIIKGPNKAFQ